MKKRLIPVLILIVYIAILIKVMVFKDIPTIKVGTLMLNFGGIDGGHPANFIPFKTIVPYLLGYKGWIIAGINLLGNIILLVPVGFLVPFVYLNMTWKKSLALAVAFGLAIEVMQVVLHVGIFDIDDVILNALGVMIGYWKFRILMRWIHAKKYKNIVIIAILLIIFAGAALYVLYPKGQPSVNIGVSAEVDLCNGTGGTGEIVSIGNSTITIKGRNSTTQIVNLTSRTEIKTSMGPGSLSDLKVGGNVTLVGGPNPDSSFTADAIFVCN